MPHAIRVFISLTFLLAAGCFGGSDEPDSNANPPPSGSTPPPAGPAPTPPPPTPTPPPPSGSAFDTKASTSRFLTQATFGPTQADVDQLTGASASQWFIDELNKRANLSVPYTLDYIDQKTGGNPSSNRPFDVNFAPIFAFWRNAIEGDDQLRQRMAFALSQIFVISTRNNDILFVPESTAHFQDILIRNAFGNYRDILQEVTYAPAMGVYLTYLQNQKGNPAEARVPDENYAREIMQLFSIGLIELQPNGEPRLDAQGEPIETYTNEDITGLARVFTGLSYDAPNFYFFNRDNLNPGALYGPMKMFPAFHSELEKSFLGTTIPAGTGGTESIDRALDAIFDHPNVGPFVGRQLIQRFVTGAPSPAYVARVAAAFDAGSFTLPDGRSVGAGVRGDMAATLAAVLFDDEARSESALSSDTFGKLREPVIRFAHWARAFRVSTVTPEFSPELWETFSPDKLQQGPFQSPSVFNFYRPGYVAPSTLTGAQDLTSPEFQLVNANSIPGFANFLTVFSFEYIQYSEDTEFFTAAEGNASFRPNYTAEAALADDPQALLDRLDELLTYETMTDETKATIIETIENIPLTNQFDPNYDGARFRVQIAVLMAMTSPDYTVQR